MPKPKIISEDDVKTRFLLLQGDSKEVLKRFPDNTFHTVVTSPPYWLLRDYFSDKQLGQESTPEKYVENLVSIMKEVKRTLRRDGAVWFNIGDSYNNNSGFCRATKGWGRKGRKDGSADKKAIKHSYIKKKELFGIPWMVATALQKDGWYLRCDIIWKKTNPMPDGAKDRPTRGHEYIFLLSKSPKYFYDYYRVLEDTDEHPDGVQGFGAKNQKGTYRMDQDRTFRHYGKRNKRAVWETSVSTFQGGHFATFPRELIEPCIKASTSEKGSCVECGSPWERIFEKIEVERPEPINKHIINKKMDSSSDMFFDHNRELKDAYVPKTIKSLELVSKGWKKSCKCKTNKTTNCLVLDPFSGTGTTGEVALSQEQRYVGIELNEEYLEISRDRINGNNNLFFEEVFTMEDIINE